MPTSLVTAARLRDLLAVDVGERPGYRGLADRVRLLVVDGRLAPGTRLPSERSLTEALGTSRTTVARAYAELRERGYLASRRGSGSVVRLPGGPGGARDGTPEAMHAGDDHGDVLAWTIASSEAVPGLGAAAARAVEALPAYLDHSGYHLAGVLALREALARRYTERGLPTDPDQVVVTAGAQAAWTLVLRTLASPGDRVAMDSPTYPNAVQGVLASGMRPVAVPLPEDGWDAAAWTSTLRGSRPRLAHLLPDFHNPTGALMDRDTRAGLGRRLARSTTTAVVDETMAELCLDVAEDDLPPPFAAGDPTAVTIGSASKSYWGGLRIGWVRAPHDVARTLLQRRPATDLGASTFDQLVLADLLGGRPQVLAGHRARLRAGRTRLLDLLAEHLPAWSATPPPGGMGLWVRLPARRSTALVAAAEHEGLLLTAGPRFYVGPGGEDRLRLPFSRGADRLEESVRRLARAWDVAGTGRPDDAGTITLTA